MPVKTKTNQLSLPTSRISRIGVLEYQGRQECLHLAIGKPVSRVDGSSGIPDADRSANERERSRDRTIFRITNPIGGDLDVLGNNEYIGWHTHRPADADSVDWASIYSKPLIMGEFGGDAGFGHHADAQTRWSEEYQEDLYRHPVAMLKRIPFLRRVTPWVLKDFRSPRRTLAGIQRHSNY